MISHDDMKKPVGLNEWALYFHTVSDHKRPDSSGTQLNIEDLSKQLRISRTPIRKPCSDWCMTGLFVRNHVSVFSSPG